MRQKKRKGTGFGALKVVIGGDFTWGRKTLGGLESSLPSNWWPAEVGSRRPLYAVRPPAEPRGTQEMRRT